MPTVLAISGSYRPDGLNHRVAQDVLAGAAAAGAETRFVSLLDYDLHFCTNCRACTQEPGDVVGRCVIEDQMGELLDACVHADGVVLASPTTMGGVTALFKRFMERLVPTAYWPWGQPAPKARPGMPRKRAVLIATAAAPTLVWRLGGFTTLRSLRSTAKMLGARVVCELRYGVASTQPVVPLTDRQRAAARRCGEKLVR